MKEKDLIKEQEEKIGNERKSKKEKIEMNKRIRRKKR